MLNVEVQQSPMKICKTKKKHSSTILCSTNIDIFPILFLLPQSPIYLQLNIQDEHLLNKCYLYLNRKLVMLYVLLQNLVHSV